MELCALTANALTIKHLHVVLRHTAFHATWRFTSRLLFVFDDVADFAAL